MIGTRAPSTMPAASAWARKVRFFASMLPASRSGTTRIWPRPATGPAMPLIARRLRVDRVVEGERAVEQAAGDLAALGHLAERRGLDGRGDLGRHRLDRRQDRDARRAEADAGPEVDGVLDDVALGVEVGEDVDRRVGDEQRLRVAGHVHDEDVADPPLGAQAGGRRRDLAHQLVGVQAALHQQLALALADQRDGLRRGGVAVRARRRSGEPARSMPCSAATPRIFASGPTRTGSISRSAAASIAPRSEVSSQGWATIVTAGVPSRAAAIRRSYFSVGRRPRARLRRQDASRRRHQLRAEAEERGDAAQPLGRRVAGRAARLDHAPQGGEGLAALLDRLGHQAGDRARAPPPRRR